MNLVVESGRITQLRKALRMSQRELAKRTGVSPAYICLLENSKQKVCSSAVAKNISIALKTSVYTLFPDYAPEKEYKDFLSEEMRDIYAKKYIGYLEKSIARRSFAYNADYDELLSSALLCFAKTLFTFREKGEASYIHYLEVSLDRMYSGELRKAKAKKRDFETLSLDAPLSHDSNLRLCDTIASEFSVEQFVINHLAKG